MNTRQRGFTLVELAIVLVIIGLLLAAIMKGQELINSGKVKNLGADFRSVSTAYYGYMDKFRAVAGDDQSATTHLGASATVATTPAGTTLGNGSINGDWFSSTATDESVIFWQHVRLASLMPGSTTVSVASGNTYQPTNAMGGHLGITGVNPDSTSPSTFRGAFYVCSGSIPGALAKQIDSSMDDGQGDNGSVRVFPSTLASTAAPTATASVADSTLYVVCAAY